MFAVYHNDKFQLVAVNFGKQDSQSIVAAISSNRCGLNGQLGNYYGVDAENADKALEAYRASTTH